MVKYFVDAVANAIQQYPVVRTMGRIVAKRFKGATYSEADKRAEKLAGLLNERYRRSKGQLMEHWALIGDERTVNTLDIDSDGEFRRPERRGNILYTCCDGLEESVSTFMGEGDGGSCPFCSRKVFYTREKLK